MALGRDDVAGVVESSFSQMCPRCVPDGPAKAGGLNQPLGYSKLRIREASVPIQNSKLKTKNSPKSLVQIAGENRSI